MVNHINLVILDDYEGELAQAPAMASARGLNVTILNRPLGAEDEGHLNSAHVLLALRREPPLIANFSPAAPI
ncbi:MAG: hypothetical protein R2911_14780 [Caldilineaceae bacterium]